MSELDEALDGLLSDKIIVITHKNGIVSKEILDKVISLNKTLYVINVEEVDDTLYKWKFDGNKLDYAINVKTNLNFGSENKELINKLNGNVDGYILSFDDNPTLPLNTEVGIKIKDKEPMYLYLYDSNEDALVLQQGELSATDDFVWIRLANTSGYFLTTTKIEMEDDSFFPLIIGASILITGLLSVLTILLSKRKTNKKSRPKQTNGNKELDESYMAKSNYTKVIWGKEDNKD